MHEAILSLVSAIIGGIFTLLGVYITFRYQAKEDSKSRKEAVKPWLFSYDMRQDFDCNDAKNFRMEIEGRYSPVLDNYILGIIKNSDNSLMVLESVKSEHNFYYPSCGNLVEKGAVINLIVRLATDKTETLKDMKLYI